MSRLDLTQLRSLPDYAEVYKWKVQFLQLPSVGIAGFPISQQLDLRCESSTIPTLTNEKITVENRGHQVRRAGRSTYSESITLTFQETVDGAIHKFAKGWRELIWSTRGGVSRPQEQIEGIIRLELLDKEDRAYWQYILYGVWLESYEPPTLDTSNDIMRIPMTFSLDFFADAPLR
jgi:hypothetical protein